MTTASQSTAPSASVSAELEAAQRLIADDDVPRRVAAVHLRSAWLQLAGGEDETERGHALARELVDSHADASVRVEQIRVVDWLFSGEHARPEPPNRADLLFHAALLREALGPRQEPRDPVLGWALTFLALVVLALAGFGTWGLLRGATGPWRVEWFAERDFTSSVRIDFIRKVDFDWGKGSPAKGIGVDDWSARFETCLDVENETRIRFKLTSDDGSRLFIDRKKVVDNWGDHASRSRTGVRTLEAGTYHLQIDYYEARHGAKLVLEVAIDDEDFGSLPLEWIRQPGFDPNAPCE